MLPGKALTTAMGILPHKNLTEAQTLALSFRYPLLASITSFSIPGRYVCSNFRNTFQG